MKTIQFSESIARRGKVTYYPSEKDKLMVFDLISGEQSEIRNNIAAVATTTNFGPSRLDTYMDLETGYVSTPTSEVDAPTRPKDIIPALDVQLKLV